MHLTEEIIQKAVSTWSPSVTVCAEVKVCSRCKLRRMSLWPQGGAGSPAGCLPSLRKRQQHQGLLTLRTSFHEKKPRRARAPAAQMVAAPVWGHCALCLGCLAGISWEGRARPTSGRCFNVFTVTPTLEGPWTSEGCQQERGGPGKTAWMEDTQAARSWGRDRLLEFRAKLRKVENRRGERVGRHPGDPPFPTGRALEKRGGNSGTGKLPDSTVRVLS